MYRLCYYVRPNGRCPCKEWREEQDQSIKPSIDARIEQLRRDGPKMLNTEMMVRITRRRARDHFAGFYELRHKGKKWRIAVYYSGETQTIVLLSGWRKSQRLQKDDVENARMLLREYLATADETQGRVEWL